MRCSQGHQGNRHISPDRRVRMYVCFYVNSDVVFRMLVMMIMLEHIQNAIGQLLRWVNGLETVCWGGITKLSASFLASLYW